MRHSNGARRWRGGRLTLDGGLVLAPLLIHRCYLRDEGRTRDPRTRVKHLLIQDAVKATVFLQLRLNIITFISCVYLSPVFPQITGLLGRKKTKKHNG